MIISKHIHSCLIIKENDKVFLIDPGEYSLEENGLDLNTITQLDYILITHEHSDHMYIPFIKHVVKKFPLIKILTNNSVKDVLEREHVSTINSIDGVEMFETPHEQVFGTNPPPNVGFNIFDRLTHPGDSLSFDGAKEILALPLQAPWCSLTQAVEKAISLKPKTIIPIHDWHWNEKARENFYQRLVDYFSGNGIEFKPLQTGEEFSL